MFSRRAAGRSGSSLFRRTGPILKKVFFSDEWFADVRAFQYGDEPWDAEVFEWLQRVRGSDPTGALDDIDLHENLVWLYHDADDTFVGFGALGPAKWCWPDEEGPQVKHMQIVFLGVDERCRGRGYAGEILVDLISEATRRSEAPFVSLFVHQDNETAAGMYERPKYGFRFLPSADEVEPSTGVRYRAMYALVRDAVTQAQFVKTP